MAECKNLIAEQIPTGQGDTLSFKLIDEEDTIKKAIHFYKQKASNEKKTGIKRRIILHLEIFYKKRTLGQNALHRSLMGIYSQEQEGTKAYADEYHEGILLRYAEDVVDRLTGSTRKMRSHEMNTVQLSKIIEADFRELAMIGLSLESAENIRHYWVEWYNWRGSQKVDPLSDTYADIENYRKTVCYCEACLQGLIGVGDEGQDIYIGHMAHIVPKGSGGSNDLWNRLHLCPAHYVLQHKQGWLELIGLYPHLAWKIERARERAGAGRLIATEPDRKDLEESKKALEIF